MIALFVGLGVILLAAVIFILLKKRQQIAAELIAKNNTDDEADLPSTDSKPQAYRATLSLEEENKSIRPESYQQRNLDREIGGLEEGKKGVEEKEEQLQKHIEDVWDKRSEEVDKIGAIDPLAGGDKESMTWRLKKIKRDIGKHKADDHDHDKEAKGSGTHFDSRHAAGGVSQIIKARQDFGHEDGGGMGR